MCGERTRASGPHCRGCQSKRHHARKDVESGNVIIDETCPGSWWIFSKTGVVLVMDKPSRDAAIQAYVDGERAEEDAA